MLGRTGRSGQQGIASHRLAIKQALWSAHAGRMGSAIVDDLDVLYRMVDLFSPPAADKAAGLQKTSSLSAKVRLRRGSEKDNSPPLAPPQLSIASQALA